MNFKELWSVISCSRKETVNIGKYLEALDTLHEDYGIVGIDRRMCNNRNKFSMRMFGHKLRFLKQKNIVRVVVDSTLPNSEWYEILSCEEWNIME